MNAFFQLLHLVFARLLTIIGWVQLYGELLKSRVQESHLLSLFFYGLLGTCKMPDKEAATSGNIQNVFYNKQLLWLVHYNTCVIRNFLSHLNKWTYRLVSFTSNLQTDPFNQQNNRFNQLHSVNVKLQQSHDIHISETVLLITEDFYSSHLAIWTK